MSTDEYVYIIPRYYIDERCVHSSLFYFDSFHFLASPFPGSTSPAKRPIVQRMHLRVAHSSPLSWLHFQEGRLIHSYACEQIEFASTDSVRMSIFKREVVRRIVDWPFNYRGPLRDYVRAVCMKAREFHLQASIYSPYLHDAMLAYALALNETIANDNRTVEEVKRDGRLIIRNLKKLSFEGYCSRQSFHTYRHFTGISGHIKFDEGGTRDAAFFIRTIDAYDAYAITGNINIFVNGTVRFELDY